MIENLQPFYFNGNENPQTFQINLERHVNNISLKKCELPNIFNIIKEGENVISIQLHNNNEIQIVQIVIPIGIYNIQELMTSMENLLNDNIAQNFNDHVTFTVQEEPVTYQLKISFYSDDGEYYPMLIDFIDNNEIRQNVLEEQLGFFEEDNDVHEFQFDLENFNEDGDVMSLNSLDLTSISIEIHCNLINNKCNEFGENSNDILDEIDNDAETFEYVTYKNNYDINLTRNYLISEYLNGMENITFSFYDEDNELIDFKSCFWSLSVRMFYLNENEERNVNTLIEKILNQYDKKI